MIRNMNALGQFRLAGLLAVLSFCTALGAQAPSVNSATPAFGGTAGGDSVTLTGSGFSGATAVTFGGVNATFSVLSNAMLTCTTPPHTSGSAPIVVTTPNGSSNGSVSFAFVAPTAPTIATIQPNNGPATGGTAVTISGSGFYGVTSVRFGNLTASSFNVQSNTSLVAITPTSTPGAVTVSVINPQGSVTTATSAYTYNVQAGQSGPNVNAGIDVDTTPGCTAGEGVLGAWLGIALLSSLYALRRRRAA